MARLLRPDATGAGRRRLAKLARCRARADRRIVRTARQVGSFPAEVAPTDLSVARKQVHVQSIIAAYRYLGNRWANLDPLQRQERPQIPELEPAFYDLTEADMDIVFSASNTYFGPENMTLREIIKALRQTYCGSIGAEYMYISDPTQKRWIQQRLESVRSTPAFSTAEKLHILERLTAAEGLERFLHTKFVGQKRFSLEGGETFIASMDELIQRAGASGVEEIVIGMAHRGRLNVLVNTLGKMPKELFAEFEGKPGLRPAGRRRQVPHGFFQRHFDAGRTGAPVTGVQPVAPRDRQSGGRGLGARAPGAAWRRRRRQGAAVLVHGDAAFAGQGVVMETLNLAQTRGYGTGGTVHIVINNQIGFTTSDPRDTRSTIVLHRRREDDRGAGVPRERRRSRKRWYWPDAARDGLRQEFDQRRRDRHRLLPPARPQRTGHAGRYAAADVQEDRRTRRHPQAVRRQAGDAGNGGCRGARPDGQGLSAGDGGGRARPPSRC